MTLMVSSIIEKIGMGLKEFLLDLKKKIIGFKKTMDERVKNLFTLRRSLSDSDMISICSIYVFLVMMLKRIIMIMMMLVVVVKTIVMVVMMLLNAIMVVDLIFHLWRSRHQPFALFPHPRHTTAKKIIALQG